MNNIFDLEVSFAKVPLKPFEWVNTSYITGLKLIKVKRDTLKKLLLCDAEIVSKENILLISDSYDSIVLKLGKDKRVVGRSFLTFQKDEIVSEMAKNMNITELNCKFSNTMLNYSLKLDEDEKMKNYLINSIKKIKDENKSKYLYYLYFDSLSGYSKEKLLNSIEKDYSSKIVDLYKFLINN